MAFNNLLYVKPSTHKYIYIHTQSNDPFLLLNLLKRNAKNHLQITQNNLSTNVEPTLLK